MVRLGALAYGTVNWELDTILSNGFDTANGFALDVVPMGGGDASDIAFLGQEIDVMVSDWLWAAARYAEGRDLKFIPYSTAVGSIMVKPESGIRTLSDLRNKRIGIAGGPLDKSWLILRAYAAGQGIDLQAQTTQEFGAPPLMFKAALNGDIDAVINFWHFQAKAAASGMQPVISVQEAAESMGLSATVPLLGYVVRGDLDPRVIQGLYRASRQAKKLLHDSDAAFDIVRPRMNVKNDAEFSALKAGFRAGIPTTTSLDLDQINRLLQFMISNGGSDLVGKTTSVPKDMFVVYDEDAGQP